MWPIVLAAGAGAGFIKSQVDADNARKKQEIEALREALSGYTGVHGNDVEMPNTIGEMMTGATIAGNAYGGIKNFEADQALKQSQIDKNVGQTPPKLRSPWVKASTVGPVADGNAYGSYLDTPGKRMSPDNQWVLVRNTV